MSLYKSLYSGLRYYLSPRKGLYTETFDKEGNPPPPPPGGRMEFQDFGDMLYEDGTTMTYEV